MHTHSTALRATIAKGAAIKAQARLIAEWNQNRYAGIQTVANAFTVDDYNNEVFPIESIVEPNRPKQGLLKARASARGRGRPEGSTAGGYSNIPSTKIVYTASADAGYKYWSSPGESASTGSPATLSNTKPYFVYSNLAQSNKIVLAFDTTIAKPVNFTVEITTDGSTWTVVSTNPTVGSDGRVVLYRQSNGTWTSTVHRASPVPLRGLRLHVTGMDSNSTHLSLIEMSLRLESDLSGYIIKYDYSGSMSEPSQVTPLGVASSNEGSVTLSNTDGLFDNSNPSSVYYGLLDKNVRFTLDLGYDVTPGGGSGTEYVRQFTLLSDVWQSSEERETTVKLIDDSMALQDKKPRPMFLESMTVGEIIWRLCDSVGFNSYQYDVRDDDPATLVPYFWCDGEKTVWSVINELAQTTQTAVYFDEYGTLKIQTRTAAYDKTRPIDWTFDETLVTASMVSSQSRPADESGKQPDIIELDVSEEYEANKINVKYATTKVSDYNKGFPVMESVWEPEGTVTLRSSALVNSTTDTSTSIKIDAADATHWPYSGIVQVEGEFIKYTSKSYSYYTSGGVLTNKYIKSNDEKVALDKINPTLSFKNHFNGNLWVGAEGRGAWNSVPAAHNVNLTGYTGRYRTTTGAVTTWKGGIIHNKNESLLRLATNKTFSPNTWYVVTRGSSTDQIPRFYGTRLRFPVSGYGYGAAGLAISAGTNDAGYFVELVRTRMLGGPNGRKYTHELCFYVRYSNGTYKRIGPDGGRGTVLAIGENAWYDLDVSYAPVGSNYQFNIAVNGVSRMSVTVPTSQGTGEAPGGRYGVFTRGWTIADFEYLYASTNAVYDGFDEEGWFDRISGGYQSSQLMRSFMYDWRKVTRIVKKKRVTSNARISGLFFDDFGPIVHEVREFDVKFTKSPVVHSRIYSSNESGAIIPEYLSTPFGAKFVMANTSRNNAVVNGQDTLTYGAENPVDHKLLIYGRVVTQDDVKVHTVENIGAIRRRGIVEVDIESQWIQSESAAKAIGDWILSNWAGGADELEVTAFGNPLIQIGDVVAVNHPSMNMSRATHKYFVVGLDYTYDGGLESRYTLRRAKV